MKLTQTIPWKPFSPKHKRYIKSALKNRMCCAEGAIRSGKTIDHCIIAFMYLEICPDKIHLASGSSSANAKLNIGDCNGFGLEHLFRGRCRWGKYKDNDALYLNTQTGQKVVIFSGGGKANSYQKILGNSYGLWIATEIIEHYDSDDSRTSFIKNAFGRQTAASWAFTLWDLNPGNPNHHIYTEYIDAYKEGFEGGYLYEHFTMADNLSISPEKMKAILSQYKPGTVWHRRDVEGKRTVAEGLIYQTFAQAPEKYLTAAPDYDYIQMGVDFGGNKSAFSFVASGLTWDYSKLTVLASERHLAKDVDPNRMYQMLGEFVAKVEAKYGEIEVIYADSAEQTLINGIKGHFSIPVRNSMKNKIIHRVRATNIIIASERFSYTEGCQSLVDALCFAVYNSKTMQDERLDNGTSDIDTLDAFEYSWERYLDGYTKYVEAG